MFIIKYTDRIKKANGMIKLIHVIGLFFLGRSLFQITLQNDIF